MRRAGFVARMGRREPYTGFWWGNPRERDQLEDPGVDGRIILRRTFRNWDGGGTEWIELAKDIEQVAGTCECGNEPSDSIK